MQKDLRRTFSILLVTCGVANLTLFILSVIIFSSDGSPANIPLLKIISQNSADFGITQISLGIVGLGIVKDVNALHSKALYRLSFLFSLIFIIANFSKFASLECTNALNPIFITFNIITFVVIIIFGISFKNASK
jgi:hypothetical protein